MGYWGKVARRAGKAALEDAKWTTPNVVTGLLVQGVSAAAIFFLLGFTEANLIGRGIAAATPFLTVPMAFLVRLVLTPPAMAREAECEIAALRPKPGPGLRGGFTLVPDTRLDEALYFAATGTWDGELPLDNARFLGLLHVSIRQFEQLAADNQIRVWSRAHAGGIIQVLPPTTWINCKLEVLEVLEGPIRLRQRVSGERVSNVVDLRVCRAQWDLNWEYLKTTVP